MSNTVQPAPALSQSSHYAAFRDLYYHLYSNSESSRAERIAEDISKLLLAKLGGDRGVDEAVKSIQANHVSVNEVLLPALSSAYPSLISEKDSFSIGDDAVRRSFQLLESIDLEHAPSHVLGEAFQALIGPRIRGDKGQFFTPRSLVRAMIRVVNPPKGAKVIDPACGTGGFLAETLVHWARGSKMEKNPSGLVIGIEKDKDLARLSSAAMEVLAPENYHIHNGDSLDILGYGDLCQKEIIRDADFVLTNPPFGSKIGITSPNILQQYDLGHVWAFSTEDDRWYRTEKLRRSQDPQLLFLELCFKLLKPGGTLGIVLPEGVFGNQKSGYVWDFVRENGLVTGLIDCPRTTFQPGTDTKTNVLFARKRTSASHKTVPRQVPIAVATNCGHDRRGRIAMVDGTPYPDDFEKIGTSFKSLDQDVWSLSTISNPHYWVPRYYDRHAFQDLENYAEAIDAELVPISELRSSGFLKTRKGNEVGAEAYGTGDIPFIRTSDISNFEISADPTKSVSEEVFDRYSTRQELTVGDLLLVMDGRYRIGQSCVVHRRDLRSVVQSHLLIITVTEDAPFSNYEFLYLINLPVITNQMRCLTFVQSTLGSLGKRFDQLLIPVPRKARAVAWRKTAARLAKALKQRAALLEDISQMGLADVEL